MQVIHQNQKLEEYYTQPKLWALDRYENETVQCLRARSIAALLGPEVESVLDVGCANGFITRYLRAKKIVVGMDPSFQALVNFQGTSVMARGESIPFADGAFEAGVCAEVLEHLSSDVLAKVVFELMRTVRETLVISVPYREDLKLSTTRCYECDREYHLDLHCRSFQGPEDILAMFPGFKQDAMMLLNHRVEIRSKFYRWAKDLFLGAEVFSEFAICPHCGIQQNRGKNRQEKHRFVRWFFDGLNWRMVRHEVPHWMILLLRRR